MGLSGQPSTISVAVIGATGYTGMELMRILVNHPKVRITAITSEKFAGRPYAEVVPSFTSLCDLKLDPLTVDRVTKRAQVVFCCLPHQEAMARVPELLEKNVRVIDLSADFRFDSVLTYQKWYAAHTAPGLLKTKVYGLPELYRRQIQAATLIGNPGCYPTSVILGLAPFLQERMIATEGIVCDSKSGVTGAGRKVEIDYLYSEINDGLKAYGVGSHRHRPEMEQELSKLAGVPVPIAFTPHLIPMDRGILSTIYARPLQKRSADDFRKVMTSFYADHPFVRVLKVGIQPNTKQVRGTNFCDIGLVVDDHSENLIITSAIDNLVKGASGQAVQNLNLMCGLDETDGLRAAALLP